MKKTLTNKHLDLYSYCPKYYSLSQRFNNEDPTSSFPNLFEQRIETIGTMLYTHALRNNDWPTLQDLDKIAEKADATHLTGILGVYVMFINKYMHQHIPFMTNYTHTFNTQYANIQITIPVLARAQNHLEAVFFKTGLSTTHNILTDWQILLAANFLYTELGFDRIIVYNFPVYDEKAFKILPATLQHRINIDSFYIPPEKLQSDLELITTSIIQGPYDPIYRCNRTNCTFYNKGCPGYSQIYKENIINYA